MKRFMQVGILCLGLCISTLALFSGCSVLPTSTSKGIQKSETTFVSQPINGLTAELKASITGSNQLGYLLVKSFTEDKNVLISPVSLSFALAMLQNGAEDETLDGILNVMGEPTQEEINQRYNGLLSTFTNEADPDDEQSLTVLLGNSFWIRDSLNPKQDFVDKLTQFYDAEVYKSDFTDPKTVDQINKWVEDKTNNLLKDTIKEISNETIAYLMNTVYFKGAWLRPYRAEATFNETFYLLDGSSTQVPMMHQSNYIDYYESDTVQIAAFPYFSGMTMKVILPKADIQTLLDETPYETLQSWLAATETINPKLNVSMPKFEYDVKNSLSEPLKVAGMSQSFDQYSADFSAMVEIEGQNVYVSEIFQNCKIINDEKGTEAAAVTVVELETTSAPVDEEEPIEFNCNKPFLYVIEDDATGAMLFIGVVVKL